MAWHHRQRAFALLFFTVIGLNRGALLGEPSVLVQAAVFSATSVLYVLRLGFRWGRP